MTQKSIVLKTTSPFPGPDLVSGSNDAFQALATDFAGAIDPSSLGGVGPNMTWADTGTLTRKRRNAAGTEWVIEGRLFKNHLPIFAVADIPTSDIEPIYVIGKGIYEWDGVSAYAPALIAYDNTDSGLAATDVKGAIDETALKSGQLINIQIFTASGSYTPTAGTKKVLVEVVGGGGGGGAGNIDNSFGGGGAGGGYARKMIDVSTLTVPETITIGAGGAAGISGGGSSGGTTSFGVHLSSNGGGAGASASTAGYSSGGAGVNGDINITGGSGDFAGSVTTYTGGRGGCAAFYSNISPGSIIGSGGVVGNGYGAGGGGGGRSTGTTRPGAEGMPGLCVVWEYA